MNKGIVIKSVKEMRLVEVLSLLALFSTFFSSFIGTTILGFVFIFLIIIMKFSKFRLSMPQFIALLCLMIYMFLLFFLANDYIVVLKNFRFWLGVVFFILYLKLYDEEKISSRFFFRLVCFSVLLETLIINTVIPAPVFYNNHPHAVLFVFYYRPLSFGGNASMSSAGLVCLYFLVSKYGEKKVTRIDQVLLLTITLLFFSGSGLLAYLLMLAYKNIFGKKINSRKNIKVITYSFLFLIFILIAMFNLDYEKVPKFSLKYYSFLLDFKIDQYKQVINFDSAKSWFFGNQLTDLQENTSGDFGWLGFVSAMGLAGVFLYFFILCTFYRGNIFTNSIFIILFISTFHYPAAMSGAGQFITAFVVTHKKKYINDRK